MHDTHVLDILTKIASTHTADEKAVEQAFGEQAYATLVQKSGPLMGEQYRLGFEIVDKNEDLTKLLGLWGFRLGRAANAQLVMSPVIFMNGRILGADLLYREGQKKFVPNNPDWAQYLIDLATQDDGKAHPRADTNKLQPLFHAEKMLRTPAGFQKGASTRSKEDTQLLTDLVVDMCRQVKAAGVLRDFIERSGVGLQAINAMERAIKESTKFARAVARTWPAAEWLPDTVREPTVKAAAAPDKVVMQLYTGSPEAATLDLALDREKVAADLYKQGYSLDVDASISAPEHTTQVFGDDDNELRSASSPSVVRLLQASGDAALVVVGHPLGAWELLDAGDVPTTGCIGVLPARRPEKSVVRLNPPENVEDGVFWRGTAPLWTSAELADKSLDDVGIPVTDVVEDELYCLFHPGEGLLTDPVYILDKRKVGEVWHLGAATHGCGNSRLLVVNPDAKKPRMRNVINAEWRAVRVSYRSRPTPEAPHWSGDSNAVSGRRAPDWFCPPLAPATSDDVRASIDNTLPVKKAAVIHEANQGEDGFYIMVDNRKSRWMSRCDAHVKLAGTLLIEPAQAGQLIDKAKEDGRVNMTLLFPEKHASAMLHLIDRENFEDTMDPIFGIRQGRDQRAVLRTQRVPVFSPASRIGDRWDSTRGVRNERDEPDSSMEQAMSVPKHIILTSSPEDIANYAETHGMPHVMDHAVFGALARTYDSEPFLDQYITRIEDGVDALGRSIFLYYWKPKDWKTMYGQDDLQEIEDKLLNAFKGTGDILLDLLKKSRNSGSPVM